MKFMMERLESPRMTYTEYELKRKNLIKENFEDFDLNWVSDSIPSVDDINKYVLDNNIKIWSFGEEFNGDLDLTKTPIENLGNLKIVNGNLDLKLSNIKSLGSLERVKGKLDLSYNNLKDFGNLKIVTGDLIIIHSKIKDLGKLEEVGGGITLQGTQFTSKQYLDRIISKMIGEPYSLKKAKYNPFNNLNRVGGNLLLFGTMLPNGETFFHHYGNDLDLIRNLVDVGGRISW